MTPKPDIFISIYPSSHDVAAATIHSPRKVIIKAGFGAQRRRCWVELYNEDCEIPLELGYTVKVEIKGIQCFWGYIQQKRIDSIDDHLSFYAEWNPEREFVRPVADLFQNQTTTQMLETILIAYELTRRDNHTHHFTFERIEFVEYPLFSTVDLLAKLSGNWIWDVYEDLTLSFRPPSLQPDHRIALKHDAYTVNLWETVEDITSYILLHGGIVDGTNYESWVAIPGSFHRSEHDYTSIYVRPVLAYDALEVLRQAIMEQMSRAHYEHYVDLIGYGETIQPGDRVQFIIDDLPLFPQNQVFRVKSRELTYAHESLQTRLYLTSGWESSPTYLYYFRHDTPLVPTMIEQPSAPFQLDVSALDSASYLDY